MAWSDYMPSFWRRNQGETSQEPSPPRQETAKAEAEPRYPVAASTEWRQQKTGAGYLEREIVGQGQDGYRAGFELRFRSGYTAQRMTTGPFASKDEATDAMRFREHARIFGTGAAVARWRQKDRFSRPETFVATVRELFPEPATERAQAARYLSCAAIHRRGAAADSGSYPLNAKAAKDAARECVARARDLRVEAQGIEPERARQRGTRL